VVGPSGFGELPGEHSSGVGDCFSGVVGMGGEMAVTDRRKGDYGEPVGCQAGGSHRGWGGQYFGGAFRLAGGGWGGAGAGVLAVPNWNRELTRQRDRGPQAWGVGPSSFGSTRLEPGADTAT
jgi:hypothetical protein